MTKNTAGIAGINARGVGSEVGTDDEPRSSMSEQYNTNKPVFVLTMPLDSQTKIVMVKTIVGRELL